MGFSSKVIGISNFPRGLAKTQPAATFRKRRFVRGFRTQVEIEDDSIEVEENPLYALIKSYRFAIKI